MIMKVVLLETTMERGADEAVMNIDHVRTEGISPKLFDRVNDAFDRAMDLTVLKRYLTFAGVI